MIIASIANGGVMMNPYVVMQVQTASGKVLSVNMPTQKAQVCSEEEAEYIGSLCRKVVSDGTGGAFRWTGNYEAGKTGNISLTVQETGDDGTQKPGVSVS